MNKKTHLYPFQVYLDTLAIDNAVKEYLKRHMSSYAKDLKTLSAWSKISKTFLTLDSKK